MMNMMMIIMTMINNDNNNKSKDTFARVSSFKLWQIIILKSFCGTCSRTTTWPQCRRNNIAILILHIYIAPFKNVRSKVLYKVYLYTTNCCYLHVIMIIISFLTLARGIGGISDGAKIRTTAALFYLKDHLVP